MVVSCTILVQAAQPRKRLASPNDNHHPPLHTNATISIMSTPNTSSKPRLFRRLGRKAARTHIHGQGFQAISFAKERRVTAKEWKEICRFYLGMYSGRLKLFIP